MKVLRVLLMLLTIGAAVVVQASSSAGAEDSRDVRCGSKCLYVALKALGHSPESLALLEQSMGGPGANGYSLRDLETEARKRGVKTLAVETTLENLGSRREHFACITLIRDNHFVLLYDVDPKVVHLLDPPNRVALPRETFNLVWTPKALLLGEEEFAMEEAVGRSRDRARAVRWLAYVALVAGILVLGWWGLARRRRKSATMLCVTLLTSIASGCAESKSKPSPPVNLYESPNYLGGAIRLEKNRYALGKVVTYGTSEYREIDLPIFNDAPSHLVLKNILLGCGCTTAQARNDVLPPHGRSSLKIRLKIGSLPVPRTSTVRIQSSDPLRPITDVALEWTAVPPIRTEPAQVDFGRVNPGESPATVVKLVICGPGVCKACRIEVLSTAQDATSEVHLSPAFSDFHKPQRKPPAVEGPAGTVKISVNPSFDVRAVRTSVVIRQICKGVELGRCDVPLNWTVSAPLDVTPNRLSLGRLQARESVASHLLISSPQGRPFKIISVSCEDGNSLVQVNHRATASTIQKVDLRFRVRSGPGAWTSRVRIETDLPDYKSFEIPVSADVRQPTAPRAS